MSKNSFYSALLIVFISSFSFLSCKKELNEDIFITDPVSSFVIPATTPVTGSLTGMVVDENNIPVNGASVKFGNNTISTNSRGIFSFNNVTLDKYVTSVAVTSPGYFKAYRSFSATASRNFVNIKLIPKTLAGTLNSNSAGSVSLTNGTEISFQANSIIVKATGAAYTGSVKVYASYIDPTATDISSVVPGSFLGRDANNLYSLQSTGMVAVDLESPSGEALQLVNGSPASIRLPIPASLLGNAPATIDTWSLNDQGVWQKEGTATKTGNYYLMQVTHFSFWNCDVPANAIYLTMHIQDQSGNALSNMLVSLHIPNSTSWWATTYGITDSMGNVSGLVPANQVLTFNAYPNIFNCNSPVNTQNIGPFAGNASLTVTATITTSQTLTISGTATNCSSQPLQNGTAIIYSGMYGYTYVPVINGNYSATQVHCAPISTVSVTVVDNSNGAQASSGNVAVSGNSVTVPVLSACGGTQTAVFTFGSSQGNCHTLPLTGTYMAGTALTGSNIIGLSVTVITPGAYNIGTGLVNGIEFSGSGVFTNTGQQTVYLIGSGTPIAGGSYSFLTASSGIAGCTFSIFVNSPPPPQAVYELGGPGPCASTTVAGNYIVGIPISPSNSNTVSFSINVISTGSYEISTGNAVNGLEFSDSGYFSTTGPRIVVLRAGGTPANTGTFTYAPRASNGTAGCTFTVTPTANSNAAIFTFVGAPSSCQPPAITGTYSVGSPIGLNSHTVTILVNVTTVGTYSIQAGMTNGINFSRNSVFTSTGVQSVLLQGFGTPTQSGLYTFLPSGSSGGGVAGCPFTLQVN